MYLRLLGAVCAVIGLGLALLVIVGMASGWSFDEWQTPDQILIGGGVVLAIGQGALLWAGHSDEVGPALLPLAMSGVIAAGLTVLHLNQGWWGIIDLASIVVFGGTGLVGLVAAREPIAGLPARHVL